jgi:hypothetical protein
MRVLLGLLIAGFLILVGACPPIAAFVGALLWAVLGLGVHGAALLFAQTAVQLLVLGSAGAWMYRNRRLA